MPVSRATAVLLLAALAGLAGSRPARAEVAADESAGRVNTILLGITDGPDPVGYHAWKPVRPFPDRTVNADGYWRGDGGPDITYDRLTWRPFLVWAYNMGTDHDIAFAEWIDGAWSPIEFLTSGVEDELDPRIHLDANGTIHVVWWSKDDTLGERVHLTRRDPGVTVWDVPVVVSNMGRRPSVRRYLGDLYVAYERDSVLQNFAQDVVAARRNGAGHWLSERVASTLREDRLDPVLHADFMRLWADWKNDALEFGHAQFDGNTWGAPSTQPWTDPSWIGVEQTRSEIRRLILAP